MGKENNQSLEYIKKYFFKNNFVKVFSILAFFSFIIGFSNSFNFSLRLDFFVQLANSFSSTLWYLLGFAFLISSFFAYKNKKYLMFFPIILWLLVSTSVVRTSNMVDLRNAATGEWELGPDLDTYLFLRKSQEIVDGENLGKIDYMRYAPVGADNSYIHSHMMPWAMVLVYNVINIFGNYSVMYAAIISPVIFFVASVIGFFFFVYLLFSFVLSDKKSLIGASIASFLYAFIPSMIHRTNAGIPEIESLGMVWFWLSFIFFSLAWKQDFKEKKINYKIIVYGLLSGLFCGAMVWSWGGFRYIFMVIALTSFLIFFFNIEKRKNLFIFGSFLFSSLIITLLSWKNFPQLFSSISDTGFSIIVFLIMLFNFFLFETKIKELKIIKEISRKTKLPENILGILLFILVAGILITLIRPTFIPDLFSRIFEHLLYPFGRGRVGLTVAENRTPYFQETLNNFGVLIWLFLIGFVFTFYESIKHFKIKKRIPLFLVFVVFVVTFVFSRISPNHILNGENFLSRFLYLGGLIFFAVFVLIVYLKSFLKKEKGIIKDFSEINIAYLVLLVFSFWGIVSMRGAIRLFFIISPIIIIVSSFFLTKILDYRKTKDDLGKILVWLMIIIGYIFVFSCFSNYAMMSVVSARQTIPSAYNQKWHHAMHWVEQNTPENSIFTHWWDYGYWVQTLGKRPTVSDGGHFTTWWDHTVARYLLTTPKPETALSLLKTHNVSYLLIDSTDVGKYTAFSTIGSDETGKDRKSWIPVMYSDPSQTQETRDSTRLIYVGGSYVDQDIFYVSEEKQIFLPEGRAVLMAVILEYFTSDAEITFSQPKGIFIYNNQRYDIPLKYIHYGGEILDFNEGINSMITMIPSIEQKSDGIGINKIGSIFYLSEKTKDSLFAQLYILDDPQNLYPELKIAHIEDDFIIKSLRAQGMNIGNFVYYNGFRGPIKIWETKYPDNVLVREEFLELTGNYAELDGSSFTK